jgi:hypothetical protein
MSPCGRNTRSAGAPQVLNSVSFPSPDPHVLKIAVGVRPNGLACDAGRGLLLVACVGDTAIPGSCTLSVVDLDKRKMLSEIPVPGRTRWALYDFGRRGLLCEHLRSAADRDRGSTEKGARTTALAPGGDRLCAFLPMTHRAAMLCGPHVEGSALHGEDLLAVAIVGLEPQ